MDHSYNNNNKWRLHAIFSDPRVWINRGSTMDQHGSTWISRLQLAAVLTHGSCVMRQTHGSCVRRPMRQASGVPRPTRQASDSTRQASDSTRPMRQTPRAPCVRLHAPHASGVRRPMRQASGVPCVRRQASHASGVQRPMRQASSVPRPSFSHRRPLSVMTDNKAAAFSHVTPFRFAPVELYGMG